MDGGGPWRLATHGAHPHPPKVQLAATTAILPGPRELPRFGSAPMPSVLHAAAAIAIAVASAAAQRHDVFVPASRDVTLYEDSSGQLTNDAGGSLFLGDNAQGLARRAAIAFDVQSRVPAGAHIVFAQIQLTIAASPTGALPLVVDVHRALNAWPEGTTAASGNGDNGVQAAVGDCTWLFRGYASTSWTTAGGDIATTPSSSVLMPASGLVAFGPTDGLVADVQAWLDGRAANHGWILKTDELGTSTVRRLHSRQTTFVGVDPQLQIGYVLPGTSWSRPGGCAGSNGPVRQSMVGNVVLGQAVTIQVQGGVPSAPTLLLLSRTLGQSRPDIVPGCSYELDAPWFDHIGPHPFDAQGTTSYTLQIPVLPAILGFSVGLQSVALDLAMPFQLAFSNGTVAVIG